VDEDKALVEYLRRSYTAVDGLWFMIVEEAYGFEQALALDEKIWQILPKIQARKAREVLGITGNSLADLAACFSLKLRADGHEFILQQRADSLEFTIHRCAWLELLRASGREHLAEQISGRICPTECRVWCEEFGGEFEFEIPQSLCHGDEVCQIVFRRKGSLRSDSQPQSGR